MRRIGRSAWAAGAVIVVVAALAFVLGLVVGRSTASNTEAAAPKPTTSSSGPGSSAPPQSSSASTTPSAPTPGSVLNLQNWYLGIPVNTPQVSGAPDIIRQPQLSSYVNPQWFHLNESGDGVVFDVNAGGYTTSGSDYPRTELREMNGTKNASWDSRKGTHTMEVTEAITKVTPAKPSMVSAQIHDANDDVLQVRLDAGSLNVDGDNGKPTFALDPNYVLGTVFTVKIVATDAGIQVFYNGNLATTMDVSGSGWYFKAGAYLQSNVDRGDDADAVGEVVIYDLTVQHTS